MCDTENGKSGLACHLLGAAKSLWYYVIDGLLTISGKLLHSCINNMRNFGWGE